MPTLEDLQRLAQESGSSLSDLVKQELTPLPLSPLSPTIPTSDDSTSLTAPQRAALQRFLSLAPSIIATARSITVTSPDTKQLAATHRQEIRAALDLLESFKRPEINRAHQAHKQALAELAQLTAPWREADEILKRAQDAYELGLRREREAAARRLEEEIRKARERSLEEQMAQAQQAKDGDQIMEVLERAAAPLPSIPVIHIPVPAAGSSTRGTHTYTLLDVGKIRPEWVMDQIRAEIGRKGRCEWLEKALQREVNERGKGAVEVVGVGSIEYSEGVSTGVRRKK